MNQPRSESNTAPISTTRKGFGSEGSRQDRNGDFIELNVRREGQKIGCKLPHQEPAHGLVFGKFAKPVRQSIS
jgi:hypothetical protein